MLGIPPSATHFSLWCVASLHVCRRPLCRSFQCSFSFLLGYSCAMWKVKEQRQGKDSVKANSQRSENPRNLVQRENMQSLTRLGMISPVALSSRYCTSLKWIAVSLWDHQLPSEVYIHDEPALLYIMSRVARCKWIKMIQTEQTYLAGIETWVQIYEMLRRNEIQLLFR